MHTILDKGPREPAPLESDADEVAVARHKHAVREHEDWHKLHKEPVKIRMHAVDARAAVAADPERYSEIARDVIARKPGSLEDRLVAIEERLDRLEGDDEPDEVDAPLETEHPEGGTNPADEPRDLGPAPGRPLPTGGLPRDGE